MANSRGNRKLMNMAGTFDPEAKYAALDERVTNMGSRITSLEQSMSRGFQQLESTINVFSTELMKSQRTPWSVIWSAAAVFITIVVMIGGLAYWPIREDTNDLKAAQIALTQSLAELAASLPDKFIPRSEQEALRERSREDRELTRERFEEIQGRIDRLEDWIIIKRIGP